jgi:hypothetical protein
LKNLYHSLKRWGSEQDIKVSIAFDLDHDLKMLKAMIEFLQTVNSTISLIPSSRFSHFSDKGLNFVSSHLESMNIATIVLKDRKITTRKLSVTTIPIKPTPIPEKCY